LGLQYFIQCICHSRHIHRTQQPIDPVRQSFLSVWPPSSPAEGSVQLSTTVGVRAAIPASTGVESPHQDDPHLYNGNEDTNNSRILGYRRVLDLQGNHRGNSRSQCQGDPNYQISTSGKTIDVVHSAVDAAACRVL
jgi:hypothetical protein